MNKKQKLSLNPENIPKKKHICNFDGCDLECQSQSALRIHLRVHTGERPYACNFEGCNATFSQSGSLVIHKRTHTRDKPYACDFEGCDATFSQSGNLVVHKRSHTRDKPYACDFEGCNATFSVKGNLISHKRIHTRDKPYACDFEGCDATFRVSDNLVKHKRIHTRERPYACDFECCNATFSQSGSLVVHKRTHTGERPYACDFESCNATFSQSGHLTGHVRSMHSVEGVKRQRKQENRVRILLTQWGLVVDEEAYINVGRGGCVPNTDRQFARVDFVVVSCTSCILIVECDEHQHYWYEISCECSRMSDVVASLRIAGCAKPIYFLRFSPNGAFEMDGVKHSRVPRIVREEHLKARILAISECPEPEQLLTIEYLFYDAEDDMPLVTMDAEYDETLAACVVPSPAPENL